MRGTIFLFLVTAGLLISPFVLLRRPWAIRIWRQFQIAVILWIVLVIVFAILNLVLRWDEIYG